MSVAISGYPSALRGPAQDRAVSDASAELRRSIDAAYVSQRPPALKLLLERISAALNKGAVAEGVFVKVEPFGRMFDLLAVLPPNVPPPEIVVESDSEIGLDWNEGHRRVLTLTVDETSYLGFAALFGHEPLHGRVIFAGTLPETLAYLFRRLYPIHTGGGQPPR